MGEIVLLLNLPDCGRSGKGYSLPLGLAYLAASLEQQNIPVKAMDLSVNKKKSYNYYLNCTNDILAQIKEIDPVVIGISCNTFNRYNVFYYSKLIKEELPHTTIVLGGPHPTFTSEDILRYHEYIDIIIRGEGELTVVELYEAITKNKSLKNVKGITYRESGKISHNADRNLIENIDMVPFPARHLFPVESYDVKRPGLPKRSSVIITSRGCPSGCRFCASSHFWHKRYRIRTPENIIAEITKVLQDNPRTRGIYFFDDTLTINKNFVTKLCNEIKINKLDFEWVTSSRVNVSRDTIQLMYKNGCRCLDFGVESGSQRVLNSIGKNITVEQVKKVARICKNVGMRSRYTWIIGLPGETYEDLNETFELIKYLGAYSTDFIVTAGTMLFPGTPFYEQFKSENPNFEWSRIPEEYKDRCFIDYKGMAIVPMIRSPYETEFLKKIRIAQFETYLHHPADFLEFIGKNLLQYWYRTTPF